MTATDLGVRTRRLSRDPRSLLAGVTAALVVVATWTVVVWRLVPGLSADRAIFVTTAELLRNGQRLYAEIWGQKDPLFYWLLALSRTPWPHGDVLLEAVYVLVAAGSASVVARAVGASRSVAVVLGFAVTPMLLTGLAYYPGYTTAPGVAGSLLLLALVLRRRWLLAGVACGVLFFLKLPLVPLGFLALGLGWWLLAGAGERGRAAIQAAIGLLVASGALVLVLATRGELTGWVQTFSRNVAYADSGAGDTGRSPGPPLWRLADVVHFPVFLPFAVVFLAAGACLLLPAARRGLRSSPALHFLAAYALASAVVSMAVLGATGIWDHHVLVLAVPAVVAVVAAAALAQRHAGSLPTIVVLALVVVAWGQRTQEIEGHPIFDPPRAIELWQQDQQTAEARALLRWRATGEFARVGNNGQPSAGYGIPGWRLVCPYFQQYIFTPPQVLDETLACLSTADVLLVSDGMAADRPAAYRSFVNDVEALVARDFHCVRYAGGRLCARQGVTR